MNSVVNNLDAWEELINGVDKSDIPIEFVKSIDIKLVEPVEGRLEIHINIEELLEQGYHYAEIDDITKHIIEELDDNIKTMNFFLDIEEVANTIQSQTNILLEKI